METKRKTKEKQNEVCGKRSQTNITYLQRKRHFNQKKSRIEYIEKKKTKQFLPFTNKSVYTTVESFMFVGQFFIDFVGHQGTVHSTTALTQSSWIL